MSDDDIPASLAEAMAEIRRLRAEAATMRHPSGEARVNTYVPPEYVSVEKARFDEMAAEIERLRAQVQYLLGRSHHRRDREAAETLRQAGGEVSQADVDHLRARVAELEAERVTLLCRSAHAADHDAAVAVVLGTLEQPTPDEPATYTHNVPPSAPPHDGG